MPAKSKMAASGPQYGRTHIKYAYFCLSFKGIVMLWIFHLLKHILEFFQVCPPIFVLHPPVAIPPQCISLLEWNNRSTSENIKNWTDLYQMDWRYFINALKIEHMPVILFGKHSTGKKRDKLELGCDKLSSAWAGCMTHSKIEGHSWFQNRQNWN